MKSPFDYEAVGQVGDTANESVDMVPLDRRGSKSSNASASSSSCSSANLDQTIDAFIRRFSALPGNAPVVLDGLNRKDILNDDDDGDNDDASSINVDDDDDANIRRSRQRQQQQQQEEEDEEDSFIFSTLTDNYHDHDAAELPRHHKSGSKRSLLSKTHSDPLVTAALSLPQPKINNGSKRFKRLSLSRSMIPTAPPPSSHPAGSNHDRPPGRQSVTAGIGRLLFHGAAQKSKSRMSEGAESALGADAASARRRDDANSGGNANGGGNAVTAAVRVDFQGAPSSPSGDSEVERIVHRLEQRNANRVPVPAEVKTQFLKLCDEACKKRVAEYAAGDAALKRSLDSTQRTSGRDGGFPSSASIRTDDIFVENDNNNHDEHGDEPVPSSTQFSSCILREDIIEIRNKIRLQLEGRTKSSRVADGIKQYFGLKCHASLLLKVLNRAVDSIDGSDHAKARFRRKLSEVNNGAAEENAMHGAHGHGNGNGNGYGGFRTNRPQRRSSSFERQRQEDEWFYYKDFVFYNLKIESKYPWMRNAGVFSILVTFTYYLLTPILWCSILRDEAICPGDEDGDSPNSVHGWLTSLYFASTTSSTVGYGDVSIFSGGEELTEPESWRIFIAILFMILSLVVSIVGFQAGLDSNFELFRRKLDLFANRVVEILKDGGIIKERSNGDDVFSKIWYAKIMLLSEIFIIFTILNLLGVFSLQFSIWLSDQDIHISWMKSLYWAVQTTTTIGYGDVTPPEGFRWFLLFYLAISTYAVGSAFGKLRDFSAKLESMRLLYAWQQQEASFAMLADFSGKPDGGDGDESKEIDQFEFTIASLVLMGKVSSKDILPIMEKFKRLTHNKPNKITPADVSGPIKRRKKKFDSIKTKQKTAREPRQYRRGSIAVGMKIVEAFREEVLSSNTTTKVTKREKQNSSVDDTISINHSQFTVPKNTYGIAIDDSKIQRKLLAKLLDLVGIPQDRCTIVGDGRDEIMGFEDYVISFIGRHPQDYFLLVVDENLDVLNDSSSHETVSGSIIVQNIRKRLPPDSEKRMIAVIRSANDSASDIAVYNSRAHGFIAKSPVKRDKVNEMLAPLWLNRFPSLDIITETCSEAGTEKGSHVSIYNAFLPYDVSRDLATIHDSIENNLHITDFARFQDKIIDLKNNLLAMRSDASIIPIIGIINLMLQNPSSDIMERWQNIRSRVDGVLSFAINKNFRVPRNTYGIALDSSRIQRKILSNFFQRIGILDNKCTIVGEKREEIMGFEDFVINFSEHHKDSFLLVIVHENLHIDNGSTEKDRISGSLFVKNIRERLSTEAEDRMLILIQSANCSPSDIAVYNSCAHGYLSSIFDGVNDLLAPLWLKKFPLSKCVNFPAGKGEIPQSPNKRTPSHFKLAQIFVDIDNLVDDDVRSKQFHMIKELLKELKGSLMALECKASMISMFGMINGILACERTDNLAQKWREVRLRIDESVDFNSLTLENSESGTMASETSQLRKISSLATRLKPSRKVCLARNRSRGSSIQSSLMMEGSLSSSTISSDLSVSSDKSLDQIFADENQDQKLESSAKLKPKSISVEFNASSIRPKPRRGTSRKDLSRTGSIDSDCSGKDLESRVSSQIYSTLFDYPSSSEAESEAHNRHRRKSRDSSNSFDQLFSLLDAKPSANSNKKVGTFSVDTIVPTKGAE